jgi:hypothetical protein
VGVSINVCQPKNTPQQVHRVPCTTDQDCSAVEPGTVCGTWMGLRGCTITCTNSSVCNPPAAGGVSIDFYGCQKDQGQSREICAPREQCIDNPTSCISGVPGLDAGFPKPGLDAGPSEPDSGLSGFDSGVPGFDSGFGFDSAAP